jgi:hypothetical protein
MTHPKPVSSRIRAGRLAAGMSLAAALSLSSFAVSSIVHAQEQASPPAAEQAVADRYVVTVSGMT